MRILIEPGAYNCLNMGDVAMLQVAVSRLRCLWPDAVIQVISNAPERLRILCPGVIPLDEGGRRTWYNDRYVFGSFHRRLPPSVSEWMVERQRKVRRRWPSLVEVIMRSKMMLKRVDQSKLSAFLESIARADVLIVSGRSALVDVHRRQMMTILDTLDLAIRHGVKTALFSQGVGVVQDPDLLARAKAILPSVDGIALRETRRGPAFLESIGVSSERIWIAGDDAIESAFEARTSEPGRAIGVNLRRSIHSKIDGHDIEIVRSVVQERARALGVRIVPIPISRNQHHGGSDVSVIRRLLAGYDQRSDGGRELDTPLEVIRQTGTCRLVVAGSYHAAVFALAQGIPAVGLAKSAYYGDKFLGLAGAFGAGCEVVFLDDDRPGERLRAAIDRGWDSAERVRPRLLAAAARQIELSRAAYRRFYELVSVENRSVAV